MNPPNSQQPPVSPLPLARRGSDAGHRSDDGRSDAESDAGSDAGSRSSSASAGEDIFINSTISGDDTHGQNIKIDHLLSSLGEKLSSGAGLRLGSFGRFPQPPAAQGLLFQRPVFPDERDNLLRPVFSRPPPPFQGVPVPGPIPFGYPPGSRPLKNEGMVWRDELRGLIGESDKTPVDTDIAAPSTDADEAGAGESVSTGPESSRDRPPTRLTAAEIGAVIGDIATRGESRKNETEYRRNGKGLDEGGDGDGGGGGSGEIKHMSTALGLVAKGYMGIDVLDKGEELPQFIGHLLDTITFLENQVNFLRRQNDSDSGSDSDPDSKSNNGNEEPDSTPRMQLLHRIFCTNDMHHHSGTISLDVPKFSRRITHDEFWLTVKESVSLPLFLARNQSVVFLVFKQHNCEVEDRFMRVPRGHGDESRATSAEPIDKIRIVSPLLQKAFEKVAMFPIYDNDPEAGITVKEMGAPYPFLFHHRRQLEELARDSETYRVVLAPLKAFLAESVEAEYQEAEAMFARGMVNLRHLGKLFKQNRIVVSLPPPGGGWYLEATVLKEFNNKRQGLGGEKLEMRGWSWRYNGTELQRQPWRKVIDLITDDETPINELPVHPVEFARPEHIEHLVRRGKAFWDMKAQVFKEYTGWDKSRTSHYVNARFMVDVLTYNKMHLSSRLGLSPDNSSISKYDKWPVNMRRESQLSEEMYMLLPTMISGFNLEEKKWVTLNVENFQPVKWNKKAFEQLVLDTKTKELIYALVDIQTSKGKSFDDMISGKGKGLIILLHGSPGTGKTLTAESVAEIAEKPLYRVTCGDIGTKAEEVEKYLQTIMYLGKAWDCVLLLDEADVFLEERTMADLQRNSLVSVFLRILEYYEGILILTSNRVGTFDEAFKSRIQVAIHYSDLTKKMRKAIWRNFLDTLEEHEDDEDAEEIDMPELERRLDDLAAEEMNGRQIRNALLTARQLAKHRKETLGWSHFSQVLKASAAFKTYLRQVRGQNDEVWAREEMLR